MIEHYADDTSEVSETEYGPEQEPTDNYYRIALPQLLFPGDDAWRKDSLCTEYPDVDFFNGGILAKRRAKAICAKCSVSAECLDFALRNAEPGGVWGGLDENERQAIIKQRKAASRG